MGFGHSEAIGRMTLAGRHRLPADTKYEAAWWERIVRIDGDFHGPKFNAAYALQCATDYAKKVSIGTLHTIRQFLEASMLHSDRPEVYLEHFTSMLNTAGKESFTTKLKRVFGLVKFWGVEATRIITDRLTPIVKTVLGYTRKRNLLVPEWADDPLIW